MSAKSALKPGDLSSPAMSRSPPSKRARYDTPVKERWSLARRSAAAAFDDLNGVDLLCDSEDEERLPSSSERQFPSPESGRSSSFTERDFEKLAEPWKGDAKSELPNYFEALSDEVVLHVFRFLPYRFLATVALVCKRWRRLSVDDSLWSRVDLAARQLQPGALGRVLGRQVVALRLASAEIRDPPILTNAYAASEEFQSRLMYLDLSMAHVSSETVFEIFRKCRKLRKVSLEHVALSSSTLEVLAENEDLEVLNLAMAEGVTEKGLVKLCERCKKLRELNLAWTSLTRVSLETLCSNLPPALDRLNLSGCRKTLTDEHVAVLTQRCRKLRELDLSDCTGLTGETIQHILKLEELNFLALSRCYQIPGRALVYLKQIPSLVYLDVHAGYMDTTELRVIQESLGPVIQLNKFKFSSIARPTVGNRRSTIWNMRVRD